MSGARRHLSAIGIVVATLLGCYATEDPVRAVLDQRLAQAPVLYHIGCDEHGACADPRRRCGLDVVDAMRAALAAGGEIAVEWEEPEGELGWWYFYWFILPDGSGEFYHFELETDDDPVCGRPGAWCREGFGPGELFDAAGGFHLAPMGSSEIRNFNECNWP